MDVDKEASEPPDALGVNRRPVRSWFEREWATSSQLATARYPRRAEHRDNRRRVCALKRVEPSMDRGADHRRLRYLAFAGQACKTRHILELFWNFEVKSQHRALQRRPAVPLTASSTGP